MSERLDALYAEADTFERWEMDNPKLYVDVADKLYLIQAIRDLQADVNQASVPNDERMAAIRSRAKAYGRWRREGVKELDQDQADVEYLLAVLDLAGEIRVGMIAARMMQEEEKDGHS